MPGFVAAPDSPQRDPAPSMAREIVDRVNAGRTSLRQTEGAAT
jgi:hypothetical protein